MDKQTQYDEIQKIEDEIEHIEYSAIYCNNRNHTDIAYIQFLKNKILKLLSK